MIDLLEPILSRYIPVSLVDPTTRMLATFVAWALVALVLLLLLRTVRVLGWRSETELDDILASELRWPLISVTFFAAVRDALRPWLAPGPAQAFYSVLARIAVVGLIVAAVWLVYRFGRGVLLRVADQWASRSETPVDDLVVPIIRTLFAPLLVGIGGILVLEVVGLPVESIALIVGGASFVLAFALRSTLEDLFGGVSLLVDTPFTYGDVLQLEDGTVCEVIELGLRVTRFYDASQHTVIVMPNRQLAGQKIINSTRPTPDLKLKIRVGVAASSTPEIVERRLLEAADAHPYIVGDARRKVEAIRRRMDRLVLRDQVDAALGLIPEIGRIEAEDSVNEAVNALNRFLLRFADSVHHFEEGAFTPTERSAISDGLRELGGLVCDVQRALTVMLLHTRRTYVKSMVPPAAVAAIHDLQEEASDARNAAGGITPELLETVHALVDRHLAPAFARAQAYREAVEAGARAALDRSRGGTAICLLGEDRRLDGFFAFQDQEKVLAEAGFSAGLADASGSGIIDLDDTQELMNQYHEWHLKMKAMRGHIDKVTTEFERGSGVLMDEKLFEFRRWIAQNFHEVPPRWKHPGVALVDFSDGLAYELRVYVDNVKLSHYTRVSKTDKQVRDDILYLLQHVEPTIELSTTTYAVVLSGQSE